MSKSPTASPEFLLRAMSAIVLATVAIALTWGGVLPFAMLVFACVAILAWEWRQMQGRDGMSLPVAAHILATGLAIVTLIAGGFLWAIVLIATGAVAAGLLVLGREERNAASFSALGVVYFGLPALAVISLRTGPEYGFLAVLFIFLIVWSEDTAAYIFGRMIGGPRLAPAISPGKTWAGLVAGLIVPAVVAFCFSLWLGKGSPMLLALAGGLLALAAQCGDLCESAIKRAFGVKDSSSLIPGHGGLLDRLDGFLFAAAAAGLAAGLRDPGNPGKALLIWP